MRDKLIELIKESVNGCATYWASLIADHLIANGVTISEWTPVSERSPEYGETVIVADAKQDVVNARHLGVGKGNTVGWMCCYVAHKPAEAKDAYTHWMPLPNPPKGE